MNHIPRITAKEIVRPFVAFALNARPEDCEIVSVGAGGVELARLDRDHFALAATFYLETVARHSPELFHELPPIVQDMPELEVRTYARVVPPTHVWVWLLVFLLLGVLLGRAI